MRGAGVRRGRLSHGARHDPDERLRPAAADVPAAQALPRQARRRSASKAARATVTVTVSGEAILDTVRGR